MRYLSELAPLPPAPGGAASGQHPHENIVDPLPNDVLCGRGGLSNNHIGNVAWRQRVADNQEEYLSMTKREKSDLSRRIVDSIRNLNPPGRFLKKDTKTGLWKDIGDKDAHRKTSQALREGAPERRKQATLEAPTALSSSVAPAVPAVPTAPSAPAAQAEKSSSAAVSAETTTSTRTPSSHIAPETTAAAVSETAVANLKQDVVSTTAYSAAATTTNFIIAATPFIGGEVQGITMDQCTGHQRAKNKNRVEEGKVESTEEKNKSKDRRREAFMREQSWGSVLCSSSWGSIKSNAVMHDLIVEESLKAIKAAVDRRSEEFKVEEVSIGLGSMSISRASIGATTATTDAMNLSRHFALSVKSLSSRSLTSRAMSLKSLSSRSLISVVSLKSLSSRSLISGDMSCGSLYDDEKDVDDNNNHSIIGVNADMPPLVSCIGDDDSDSKFSYGCESVDNSYNDDDNDDNSVFSSGTLGTVLHQDNYYIVDRCPMPQLQI